MQVKAYWYRTVANFGDLLTPWLLGKLGFHARWTKPHSARFFGVGSIGQRIPAGFDGVVWGTGTLKPTVLPLENATVLALRGPLTGDAGLYADPGLLAGLYRPQTAVRHKVGVLSHYIQSLPFEGHRIDVLSGVENVIREAAGCDRIISNSLHGIILADSLGIPNRWIYSDKVIGNGHKFADYAASFGQTIGPDRWRLAPQDQVAEKQQALIATIERIGASDVMD